MKKTYLVLEVREETILSSAWLSSDGVKTEDVSGSVVGIYIQEFDNELDAAGSIVTLGQDPKNQDKSYTILPLYKKSK